MKSIFRTTLIASVCFCALSGAAVHAQTIIVGNNAIPRTFEPGDTALSPFVMILGEDMFPCGTITEWEVHIARNLGTSDVGTMGLLVITPTETEHANGRRSVSYSVSGVDIRTTLEAGLNRFEGTSIPTQKGDVLGLYIASAHVSLDYSWNSPSGPITYFLNEGIPEIGDELLDLDGRSIRTYSINATVDDQCSELVS